MTRSKYIIGNWKLHKDNKEIDKFFAAFNKLVTTDDSIVYGFAPTHVCLAHALKAKKKTSTLIIGQDVSSQLEGSLTGQVSAKQLQVLGLKYCIVGHSETRQFLAVTDQDINKKVLALIQCGIKPIICIGENAKQKAHPEKVLEKQLTTIFKHVKPEEACQCLIAYEPVWAIGSGLTPSLNKIKETTNFIRKTIKQLFNGIVANKVGILYGGSVGVDNALDIMKQKDVDGLLIGSVSLDPKKFTTIMKKVSVWKRK